MLGPRPTTRGNDHEETTVHQRALGSQGLTVSAEGLGCMGMSAFYGPFDDAEPTATLHRALELGVTFFDTAEMYGPYINEELLGAALGADRDSVVVATKGGTLRHLDDHSYGYDGRPENMRLALEGSLKRLGTDHIDLYYQHRMDPATPIEDTVGAMAEFVTEGKIRGYGLSEAAPERIRAAHAIHPITAIQTEYSLWSRDPESELLPLLRELGIGFVPYSPLGRGFLTGAIRSTESLDADDFRRNNPRFESDNLAENLKIVDAVEAVAAEAGATPAQVALAWILAQGEGIAPIPGTKRVARLEENVAADSVELTPQQLATLSSLPQPAGDRYADMSAVNR
jgi:aryl-alcohol dehydrogenase-like predicted oxidoreductase